MLRVIPLILVLGVCGMVRADEPAADVRTSISKGLEYLTDKGIDWKEDRKCASCHHISWTLWSLNEAKKSGFTVDEKTLTELTSWVLLPEDPGKVFPVPPPKKPDAAAPAKDKEVAPAQDKEVTAPKESADPKQPKATEQADTPEFVNVNISSLLLSFGVGSGDTSSEATREALKKMLNDVIKKQHADGGWKLNMFSEPISSSPDVLTGFALLALTEPNAPDMGEAGKTAKEKGIQFFTANPGDTLQGLVVRLLVWRRLSRPETDWQPVLKEILGRQNADGGWSQTKEMASDAYATGQVLYALSYSAVAADDPAVLKAHAFLAKTQEKDGSWAMIPRPRSRDGNPAKNVEPITYTGTSWAILGLLKTLPPKK